MFRDFFSLLFPDPCPGCGQALLKNEPVICTICHLNLPFYPYNNLPDNPLLTRLWGRIHIHHAYAYLKFKKGSSVQKLLFAMKYSGNEALCYFFGKAFGFEIQRISQVKFDFIVPVPLHATKIKTRGYNQAEKIASGLSEVLKIPVLPDALQKSSSGVSQTRKKREERYENVKKLYRIKEGVFIDGQNILLVDDVITTGATFEVCGNLLYDGGAKSVSIAALAAAD